MSIFLQSSQELKEAARRSLHTWAGGFGRSSSGKPYLLTELLRSTLFPKAPLTAVVTAEKASPILASLQSHLQGLDTGLQHMDLSLEQMEDLTGEGVQVGDHSLDNNTTTFRPIPQPSPASESSSAFSGFRPSANVVTKAKLKMLSSAQSCPPKDKLARKHPKPKTRLPQEVTLSKGSSRQRLSGSGFHPITG